MISEKRPQHRPEVIFRKLLAALENARTRLAVAIALETKATPLERWRYYLETAEEMRRCLKRLRAYPEDAIASQPGWTDVLNTLRQLPEKPDPGRRRSEANQLCQCLRSVVARIDQTGAASCPEAEDNDPATHAERIGRPIPIPKNSGI